MRAPESPGETRPEGTLSAILDTVVTAALVGGAGAAPRDVNPRVRALCDEARRGNVPVERLLVLLKERWWRHPAVRSASRGEAGDRVAHLVTLCIHEFYREGRASAPPTALVTGREASLSPARADAGDRRGAS